MPAGLKPHSPEWFSALDASNPTQAAHTRQILKAAGRTDVCSVCGDHHADDYAAMVENLPSGVVTSIRLCSDCRTMRELMDGHRYEPLGI
jgi:hypothetical protein